jgi:hypothetical protein
MQVHSIEINILEIGLFDERTTNNNGQIQTRRHLDQLYSCLLATKSFFDSFFQFPISIYTILPFSVWSQFASAIFTASKLLLLDCLDWDLEQAREVLEFPTVVGEISKRFQESSFLTFGENAGDEDDNLLLWYSQRLDWVKGWFEAKTAADAPSKAPTTGDEAALNFGDATNGYLLSSDDDFWQEFMREWGGMSSF